MSGLRKLISKVEFPEKRNILNVRMTVEVNTKEELLNYGKIKTESCST